MFELGKNRAFQRWGAWDKSSGRGEIFWGGFSVHSET